MFIVDTERTSIGKYKGTLSESSAPQLAAELIRTLLGKYPFLKQETDEVILGNVISAGIGMNPARMASILGGISPLVPAYTINHVCGSGMSSIILGTRAIRGDHAQLVLAGGMESMSQAPENNLQHDGLLCSISGMMMSETAETLTLKYHITRQEQDAYALLSHTRALAAPDHLRYHDSGPRVDTSLEKLSELKTLHPKGTVTAGNASSLADGAAIMLLASQNALRTHTLSPLARIVDSVMVGVDPEYMGTAPISAIQTLLERNKLDTKDIDLFEINEAFAVQVLTTIQELHLDIGKVNIDGGAIALGHPLGMSGARIVMNLVQALRRMNLHLGIATACIGGGQGVALLIQVAT